MSEINTAISSLPRGLLGFLGLKNGGAYPARLSDVYVPTLNLLDLIGDNMAQEVISGTQVGVVAPSSYSDSGGVMTCPANQMWYVRSYEVYASTAAGEVLRLRPIVTSANPVAAGRQIGHECASSLTDAVGVGFVRGLLWGPIILQPSQILGCDVSKITSAGITLNFRATIYRFPG